MSEMIERVGRALAEAEGYAYDPVPYDERARAAIAAMRRATPDVEWAVARSAWHMGSGRMASQIINDFIDAVLT